MTLPVEVNPLLLAADDSYNIQRSLRFRASASAFLNRTPASAGNRRTFTISAWVKRGLLTPAGIMFSARIDNDNRSDIYFNPTGITFQLVNAGTTRLIDTSAVFRDPSSWYHIVAAFDTTQATDTNRIKLYINGVQQTITSSLNGFPTQNMDTMFNNNSVQRIGVNSFDPQGSYFDGYMTEVIMVDGQALTPSSFGENNAQTGVWQPKKYAGTYGTNGFYLPFTDNSGATATTIGKDFSGNSNNWTPNNISVTAGVNYDSMTDVPTLTSATQANYCVFNPLDRGSTNFTLSNGNLNIVGASASSAVRATMAVSSGKWYWEATPTAIGNGLGVGFAGDSSRFNPATWNAGTYVIYQSDGNKHINGSASSYGASYTTNDVIGVALDMDAGTITFYKNNVSQGTASTGLTGVYLPVFAQTSGATTGTINANFGAGSGFAYTPPTGFVALNTFNLPTPTIGATASTQANKYFDISLWSGNSTARSITNSGSMQPDFVWIKERSYINWNDLADSVRGADKHLFSSETLAEFTLTDRLTSFNSNGFSLGNATAVNNTGETYVGWQWKAGGTPAVTNTAGSITSTVSANTSAGFSIVTYTGNGTNGASYGHGLGVTPAMVITKPRSTTGGWNVWHRSLPANNYLELNTTAAQDTATGFLTPSSSVNTFTTSYSSLNGNGTTFVAYCFAEVAGYSRFGSYRGNGSSDGTFVFTGFRPRYVMVKSSSSAGTDWIIWDSARNTFNVMNDSLAANLSDAEKSGTTNIDFLSNGFKFRFPSSNWNSNGVTYIFMAFAENPFKYSLAR